MKEFIFGPFGVVGWMFASAVMLFFAAWIWQIVIEAGGLRGTAMATLFTCLSILFACFALLLHDDPRISKFIVGMVATAVCAPMPFSAFILADLYAASRNNHRSFTARSYGFYKRLTSDEREERNPRHPISTHS